MPIDTSLFDRDMEIIRQRRGPDAIRMANQTQALERIPLLDPMFPTIMRITSGGIPCGRVVRIHGSPSAGKTQLAYWIIRAAQRYRSARFPDGLKCCYWNIEGQFVEQYAAEIGIDTSVLALEEGDIIEDIAGELELLLTSIHLHVIDSASFASPRDELSIDPQKEPARALHARAWKRAISRIHHRMDKDHNIVIVIDHETEDMQGHTQPLSGKRMAYRSDLSIQMSRGAWLFYDQHGELVSNDVLKEKTKFGLGAAGTKEADGSEVTVRVPKSRVCRPLRTGKMRLDLNTMRFDTAFELAEHARFMDTNGQPAHRTGLPPIAPANGTWYQLPGYVDDKRRKFEGWSWEEKDVVRAHGLRGLCTAIRDDERLQEFILSTMMKEG